MSKVVEVHLEWKYTPSNYLEQPIKISKPGIQLEISGGVAVAHIEPETFEKDSSLSDDLTKLIENRLYAVQVLTHKIFSLSKPSRTDLREDGKRNFFLETHSVSMSIVSDSVDLIITDKDGNVVSDTKQDRLDKQKWFSETVDRYRNTDITLDYILKSYQMSISDPNNEFVHLYEIRDALQEEFGNRKKAFKELGITDKEWKVIGDLADNQPLEQGRHRGKFVGVLRAAERSELDAARKSAAYFIEKYLVYLEKNCKSK